jgi:hypothetical protein
METPAAQVSRPPTSRPPLGLPEGSVRALLTLLIVAVVIVQVVRGEDVALLWRETLMICLAYYFTTRRFIRLPSRVIQELEHEGYAEEEKNPLYLPRRSIRVIIVLAFVGLAVYLYQADALFQPQALSILGVVFSYILGMVFRVLLDWWTKGRKTSAIRLWEDLKAVVVLFVMVITAGAYLLDYQELLPRELRNATLGLVLFYFGSR